MYSSDSEIEDVVRGFETCQTDKAAFKHQQHLTVAVSYLQNGDRQTALERMRTGLLRFLDHHRVPREKYSEAVTVFWLDLIAEKLAELGPDASLVDRCNYVLSSPTHTPASRVEAEVSPVKS